MLNAFFKPLTLEEKIITGGSFGTTVWKVIPGEWTGFIQPIGGGESFKDGKAGESATHRLYTDVTTPGVYGHKITQNDQEYIVIYAIQPNGISGIDRHKEIILGVFE